MQKSTIYVHLSIYCTRQKVILLQFLIYSEVHTFALFCLPLKPMINYVLYYGTFCIHYRAWKKIMEHPIKGVTQLLLFAVLYAKGRKLNYQRAPE